MRLTSSNFEKRKRQFLSLTANAGPIALYPRNNVWMWLWQVLLVETWNVLCNANQILIMKFKWLIEAFADLHDKWRNDSMKSPKTLQNEKTARKSRMTHLACAKVEKQNQKQQKKRPKATYSQLTKCKLSIDNLFFVLNNLTTIRFSILR